MRKLCNWAIKWIIRMGKEGIITMVFLLCFAIAYEWYSVTYKAESTINMSTVLQYTTLLSLFRFYALYGRNKEAARNMKQDYKILDSKLNGITDEFKTIKKDVISLKLAKDGKEW